MIYSVWNHSIRAYDYYKSPESDDQVNTGSPKHLRRQDGGLPADRAAWPLPPTARHIGSGELPRGHIATPRTPSALDGLDLSLSSPVTLAGLALAGYLAWRYL